MEQVTSDHRLRELIGGDGYIYNDFAGKSETTSSKSFNVLHRATCGECAPSREGHRMTVKTSGQKIFFATSKEAIDWLMDNRPGNYTRCNKCKA